MSYYAILDQFSYLALFRFCLFACPYFFFFFGATMLTTVHNRETFAMGHGVQKTKDYELQVKGNTVGNKKKNVGSVHSSAMVTLRFQHFYSIS